MGNIEGVLIDVDGVLRIDYDPIPGAVDALRELRQRGIPFRLLTNTTVRTRHSLGALLRRMGFDVDDEEIITAGAATAALSAAPLSGSALLPDRDRGCCGRFRGRAADRRQQTPR